MDISGQVGVNFYLTNNQASNTTSLTEGTTGNNVQQSTDYAEKLQSKDVYESSLSNEDLQELLANGLIQDISHLAVQHGPSDDEIVTSDYDQRKEGMTIVDNYVHDLVATEIQPSQTHGFFAQDMSFLEEAAKQYATLEDGEMFLFRSISDSEFISETLDFFTGGDYTKEDYAKFQDQMTDVIFELAEQLKNGEELDYSKLETKLTIGDTEATFGEIMGFQTVGKELQTAFKNLSTSDKVKTDTHGSMGLAMGMANYYASDKGELGEMFSNAMNTLYEDAIDTLKYQVEFGIKNLYPPSEQYSAFCRENINLSTGIADSFSKIDTSSKESMKNSFDEVLKQARESVSNFESNYNVNYGTLTSDTAKLIEKFNSWMELVD